MVPLDASRKKENSVVFVYIFFWEYQRNKIETESQTLTDGVTKEKKYSEDEMSEKEKEETVKNSRNINEIVSFNI